MKTVPNEMNTQNQSSLNDEERFIALSKKRDTALRNFLTSFATYADQPDFSPEPGIPYDKILSQLCADPQIFDEISLQLKTAEIVSQREDSPNQKSAQELLAHFVEYKAILGELQTLNTGWSDDDEKVFKFCATQNPFLKTEIQTILNAIATEKNPENLQQLFTGVLEALNGKDSKTLVMLSGTEFSYKDNDQSLLDTLKTIKQEGERAGYQESLIEPLNKVMSQLLSAISVEHQTNISEARKSSDVALRNFLMKFADYNEEKIELTGVPYDEIVKNLLSDKNLGEVFAELNDAVPVLMTGDEEQKNTALELLESFMEYESTLEALERLDENTHPNEIKMFEECFAQKSNLNTRMNNVLMMGAEKDSALLAFMNSAQEFFTGEKEIFKTSSPDELSDAMVEMIEKSYMQDVLKDAVLEVKTEGPKKELAIELITAFETYVEALEHVEKEGVPVGHDKLFLDILSPQLDELQDQFSEKETKMEKLQEQPVEKESTLVRTQSNIEHTSKLPPAPFKKPPKELESQKLDEKKKNIPPDPTRTV